jgi:hypothetical protein
MSCSKICNTRRRLGTIFFIVAVSFWSDGRVTAIDGHGVRRLRFRLAGGLYVLRQDVAVTAGDPQAAVLRVPPCDGLFPHQRGRQRLLHAPGKQRARVPPAHRSVALNRGSQRCDALAGPFEFSGLMPKFKRKFVAFSAAEEQFGLEFDGEPTR